MYNSKVISVADTLSWKIEEQKEGNKNISLLCYRQHLNEALIIANESENYTKQYFKVLEHFKELVTHKIEVTSTGEYSLKHSNNNKWNHRKKDTIIKSYFEYILKRVCLQDEVNFKESLSVVFAMKNENILKDF